MRLGAGPGPGPAFLRLLMLVSHPHDAVLGLGETGAGAYATEEPEGRRVPGLLIYRFDSALLFYNADYFKQRLQAVVNAEETRVEWGLLDAESIPVLDITGAATLEDLHRALADRGIGLAIARTGGPLFRRTLERTGLLRTIGSSRVFETREGVEAFRRRGPHRSAE
jgi:MFS superfamily sulfate permease-like transporter